MTTYVILHRDPNGDPEWTPSTAVDAPSAPAAQRDAAKRLCGPDNPLEIVAVPARNWQPQSFAIETQTRVVKA